MRDHFVGLFVVLVVHLVRDLAEGQILVVVDLSNLGEGPLTVLAYEKEIRLEPQGSVVDLFPCLVVVRLAFRA